MANKNQNLSMLKTQLELDNKVLQERDKNISKENLNYRIQLAEYVLCYVINLLVVVVVLI